MSFCSCPSTFHISAALREEDLFDAVSEEEARLNAAVRSAADGANADFGAKVRQWMWHSPWVATSHSAGRTPSLTLLGSAPVSSSRQNCRPSTHRSHHSPHPSLPSAQVSMLLSELAAMRAADPGAKAVVFSSWGRLLKLVGNALDQVRGGCYGCLGAAVLLPLLLLDSRLLLAHAVDGINIV